MGGGVVASMLKRFVVGIGADTKGFEQGQRDVTRGLNNMRSTALISGTAITSMLAGMGLHAVKTAKEMTDLNNAMQFSDADAQYVANMDAAIVRMGGSVGTAIQEYQHFEKILDDLHNKGNAEVFIQLAYAGVKQNDANYIQASKDVQEMQKRIAEVAPQYDDSVVRRMREALGVSEATMVLYSKGADNLQKQLNISRSLIGDINTMKEDSAALVDSWEALWQNAKGFGNELAQSSMPAMNKIAQGSSTLLTNLRELRKLEASASKRLMEDNPLVKKEGVKSFDDALMGWFKGDKSPTINANGKANNKDEDGFYTRLDKAYTGFLNNTDAKIMDWMQSVDDFVLGGSDKYTKGAIGSYGMDKVQLNASVPTFSAMPQLQQSNKQQPIVIKLQNDNKFEVNGRIFAESVTEVIENINNTVFSGMQGNINR